MRHGPSDDLSLARRVAAGDEAALKSLYARCADPLYAFICHHLDGASPDAEEIWQNSLLAGLQSLGRYSGQSRLFTWLCGIARHKIADHFRRLGQPVAAFSEMRAEQLAALFDAGPLPEEILAQKDTRIQVVRALGTLPANYRQALVARYADGCSVDEVAQLLGTTYKAAESLLSRARKAFRATFRKIEEYDER